MPLHWAQNIKGSLSSNVTQIALFFGESRSVLAPQPCHFRACICISHIDPTHPPSNSLNQHPNIISLTSNPLNPAHKHVILPIRSKATVRCKSSVSARNSEVCSTAYRNSGIPIGLATVLMGSYVHDAEVPRGKLTPVLWNVAGN